MLPAFFRMKSSPIEGLYQLKNSFFLILNQKQKYEELFIHPT